MSASDRLPLLFFQPVNGSGVPYPAATLTALQANTANLQNTYSDAALSVLNQNPIPANGNGKFPPIFLVPGLTYDFVLKDSAGATLDTIEDVAVPTTSAATTSAAGIVELATNAEARTGTDTGRVPPVSATVQMILQDFNYSAAGGTANAITGTPTITPDALASGMDVVIRATSTNTGATTLNWAGTGVVAVRAAGGAGATACIGGEIITGNLYCFTYSGADSAWVVSPIGQGFGSIHALTEDTTPDGTADFWAMYDFSAKLPKKVLPSSLAATQTQQEAGSSAGAMVSPARQQFHKSAMKGQASFNGTGVVSIYSNSDYNVSSITDNGVGTYVANYTTAFSASTAHGTTVSTEQAVATNEYAELDTAAAKTTTTQGLCCGRNTGGVRVDKDPVDFMTFGDF